MSADLYLRRRQDPMRTCAGCAFAMLRENGNVMCGSGVDDQALQAGDDSKNPIWAVRKYGHASVLAMLQGKMTEFPPGSDCENLKPEDGSECATYQRRETIHGGSAESVRNLIDDRARRLEQAIPKVAARWLSEGPPKGIVHLERVSDFNPRRARDPFPQTDMLLGSAAKFLGPDFDWEIAEIIGGPPIIRATRYRGDDPE